MTFMFVHKARLWTWSIAICAAWLCSGDVLAQSSDTSALERYAEEGQRALAEGRYSEAEQAFEKLRELEPGMAEVHANLGLIYFQERKFEQAVPALRQALKLKPTLSKSDSLLAMSLSELGHYQEALPGLEKGFHRSPDPAIKRMSGLQLERAYSGLRRDDKAVEVALELNRLYPDDPEILYNNGKIFGNFAFLNIQKLSQVAPNSVWRHLAAAEAQESQGAYEQAIAEYREVLRLAPERAGIHYRIGRTLLARFWERHAPEDSTAAGKEFEEELQVDPSNANAAYELGEMHRKAKQIDEAQRYFEQALSHLSEFRGGSPGAGCRAVAEKSAGAGSGACTKGSGGESQNEVCWYRLSQIQGRLGNRAEQQKASAEFQRLHDQSTRQKGFDPAVRPLR